MKYTGQFKDINENLYTVNIVTDNDSSTTKTVTLGTTPFVTEVETSEEHLYKPVKYSSATVRMINDDYSFDLYSAEAQENKVTFIDKDNVIRWIGYTTPNLYSQGYENEVEEIEIECIDALATLQYYKYKPISGTKEIVYFTDLINHILSKCNAYTKFYISDNTQSEYHSYYGESCLITQLFISEQDFFDEDDEPMTFQEVLEEICKYLNVTCIADGTSVYFLDYDAIKNGINTYYEFTVGNTSTSTLVTLSQSHAINGSDYVLNGGQISLDNVYNKVKVKDSLYTFEPVIPEIFGKGLIQYLKYDFNNNLVLYDEFEVTHPMPKATYKCFFKYYTHNNYKTYYYDKTTLNQTKPLGVVTYLTLQQYVGATIVKHCNKKIEEDKDNIINEIDWKDYILLHCHNKHDGTLRPLFELNINDMPPSILSQYSYFVIKGSMTPLNVYDDMVKFEGYSREDDDFKAENLYLTCSMECGNRYYNGQYWQTEFCTFKLPFDANDNTDHHINKTFQVKNNIDYTMMLDCAGYAIRVPSLLTELATYNVKPVFKIYQPHKIDNGEDIHSVWLENFEIVVKLPVQENLHDEDINTDTEYSNVIDGDYVNELDDEEFKICTWDNKANNYSSVGFVDTVFDVTDFLNKTFNKATKMTLRQEEQYIYRLVNQYRTPSCIINVNLKNTIKPYCLLSDKWLPNKLFIVDSITTDWEYNKAEIKLIEKK